MTTVYQLGIVGESNYQSAIRRCSPGNAVKIVHEPDNPYDDCALAVLTKDGATIGYVPRSCWLQDAIHHEGKGCEATIKSIKTAGDGILGVVLDVRLNTVGVAEREFKQRKRPQIQLSVQSSSGFIRRIFGL